MIIKPYLTVRNISIAIAVVFVLIALVSLFGNKGIALYESLKQAEIYKVENAKLKEEVESKSKIIDENLALIKILEKDRVTLAKKIVVVRAKREAIKNPKDTEEIVDRLKFLGLNPQVNK